MSVKYQLMLGDCLDILPTLEANSVDSVVCDPPYGLAFMSKRWDYDVPKAEVWREVLRVLKPGGHLLSFGGSRTFHRVVVEIEDAGFEIRDTVCWLYGTGFPKSLDVSKAIDEAENVVNQWQGWGTALKPAFEPIVLARKPLSERTIAANVLKWGTGGINIAACRIKARFPANVVLDEEAATFLDKQTGIKKSGKMAAGTKRKNTSGYAGPMPMQTNTETYGDTGFASRFFYCAKASRKERGEGNNHPTVKPVSLMEWLVKLVTPEGGIVLDPFMGSGTTGVAALNLGFRFVGIEREQSYLDIARSRIEDPESLDFLPSA